MKDKRFTFMQDFGQASSNKVKYSKAYKLYSLEKTLMMISGRIIF